MKAGTYLKMVRLFIDTLRSYYFEIGLSLDDLINVLDAFIRPKCWTSDNLICLNVVQFAKGESSAQGGDLQTF